MSIFSKIEKTKLRTNTFDLSHDRKFSAKMGRLVPILCEDMIPGDTFHLNTNVMLRFAPMIAPVMHRVNVYCHFFFVPNRLLWDNWEDFITGGREGDFEAIPPTITFNNGDALKGTLYDYLGFPTEDSWVGTPSGTKNITASAFPFSAYQFIYNEYYRDQNFEDENDYKLIDGNNGVIKSSLKEMRFRAWQHDYFTSALPWTQRGPEATVPLGTSAPLHFVDGTEDSSSLQTYAYDRNGNPMTLAGNADFKVEAGTGDIYLDNDVEKQGARLDVTNYTYADLSTATASSITELRRAFKLQEWLEKSARGGSRYTENIETFFGVRSQDARLQRPEYIGGYSSPVKISEVLNTTGTTELPQGNMAGHGISIGGSSRNSYYAREHGWIIGIMSVLPMTAYQGSLPRKFNRENRFDYYWPQFAHIGEQAIQNQEMNFSWSNDNKETWGYVPRYSEYKFINSSVHGDFRDTLDFWHLGRKFQGFRPPLNSAFVQCGDIDIQVDRIFAVQDGTDYLWCHVFHNLKAKRPMPYFGNPKF